jgi:glycosyltransferase involved in cell wall biosynthesis
MNLFIIPSWYPSEDFPSTGIFFKEQAEMLAMKREDWKIGICLWGSHEPSLWLKPTTPLESLFKRFSKLPLKQRDHALQPNCVEFFTPALTWMRRIAGGNIEGIVKACEENLQRHISYFGKPDVLFAQVSHPGGYVAQKLAQRYNIPFVIVEHMSPFPMLSYKRDFRKWVLSPLKAANLTLAVSDHLRTLLSKYDMKAELTSNFIDDEYWNVPEKTVENDKIILVAVGRLTAQKNYSLMLHTVAELKNRGVLFQLRILGAGEELSKLNRLTKSLGIADDVIFFGECERSVVRQHYQESNIFLSTSKHENQPVAMLETMACGLPVITTDWMGATEMINEELGQVLNFDAIDIADAIQKMALNNSFKKPAIRSTFESKYGSDKAISLLENHLKSLI